MGDRKHPCAEVGILPQTWIRTKRRQERLLEAVLGLPPADQGHQEPIDVLAVRIEEILKRWKSHTRLNASPAHRVRSLGRRVHPEGLVNAPCHAVGKCPVQAIFGVTEPR